MSALYEPSFYEFSQYSKGIQFWYFSECYFISQVVKLDFKSSCDNYSFIKNPISAMLILLNF